MARPPLMAGTRLLVQARLHSWGVGASSLRMYSLTEAQAVCNSSTLEPSLVEQIPKHSMAQCGPVPASSRLSVLYALYVEWSDSRV